MTTIEVKASSAAWSSQVRTVRLRRQPDGSLGIGIKGGVDHNLPILVSKVCRNEDDDHLYIGDAIVRGTFWMWGF